jgi:hypothetical protein
MADFACFIPNTAIIFSKYQDIYGSFHNIIASNPDWLTRVLVNVDSAALAALDYQSYRYATLCQHIATFKTQPKRVGFSLTNDLPCLTFMWSRG